MSVEQSLKDYNKNANRWIYSNYFDITDALDSSLFCQYIDAYQGGQSSSESSPDHTR